MEEPADFFDEVVDYRELGRCRHELSDIIWLVLCGLLADCETFADICDYACDKEAVLREFLSLPAGIPPHDTLNRVFRRLDPLQPEASLARWGTAIVAQLVGRQLIVDGKQLRGTTVAGRRQASVQLVSVWAAEQRLCLAQTCVAEKRSEATAMPQVLELVDVAGSVVSLDALAARARHHGHALLPLLAGPGQRRRAGRLHPRPLGHRKPPALAPGRHVGRRWLPLSARPRPAQSVHVAQAGPEPVTTG